MATPVYTYYMPVPGLWPEDTQRRLIDVWRYSWKLRGWDPIVLDESHARLHPRYAYFKGAFWSLPTEYGHDYEGACFMRWLAVAAQGGGMMVDYDVINYSFAPQAPRAEEMIIFADSPPDVIFMGAVLGTQAHFEAMATMFAEWAPGEHDKNHRLGILHCSDLSALERMFHGTSWPKPSWLTRATGCALFPNPTWTTAPMTHYGYAMRAAGYWPKWEHIPKIRPML